MAKKILIVDDEDKIRQLEKVLFTKSGFEVESASNGNEAVEKAREFKPDVIVCDIEMPGKDGYATVMELRGIEGLKDVPVIMLSGLRDEVYHKISESLGTVTHLDKPFDPNKLLNTVKEITG